MEKNTHIEAHLKQLGLTEYECKAYIALTQHSILSADEIANIAKIPLPRVYDTMNELEKRGFVLSVKTRPKKYKAVDIKEALYSILEQEKNEYERKTQNLRKLTTDISRLLKPIKKIEGVEREKSNLAIVSFKSRANAVRSRRLLFLMAKKEILILSYDASWIPEDIPILKKIIKNGIAIKMICNVKPENKKIIRQAMSIGIEVRNANPGIVRGQIIDGEKAHLVFKTPIAEKEFGVVGDDTSAHYETLFIENFMPLVELFKGFFENLWQNGKIVKY